MKYVIFKEEDPILILDRSYTTNIQVLCKTVEEALTLIEEYTDKNWGDFSISRGGNITEYTGYILEAVVIDLVGDIVVHFILTQFEEGVMNQYAEAGRILLGESS